VGIGRMTCGGDVGSAPGDGGLVMVGVPVSVVVVVVEGVELVAGGVVVVAGAVVDGVVVVVTDAGAGRPCAIRMIPKTITPIRAAITTPHPIIGRVLLFARSCFATGADASRRGASDRRSHAGRY